MVVAGILIALQIDNLNEDRKNKIHEQQILTNLHEEFTQNKHIIELRKRAVNKSSDCCFTLMDLMNKNAVEIATHNVDSLIYNSIEHAAFTPSDNTLYHHALLQAEYEILTTIIDDIINHTEEVN